MLRVLTIAVTVSSGIVGGVLFAVALSVLPALSAMPVGQYVYAHKLIGRNWDPTMPVIVLSSTVVDSVLAFLVPGSARVLFMVAAVLLLAVSIVSHYCNVPINRRVKAVDPASIPPDWHDPRPVWRRWHLLRTALAVFAAAVNATALGLL
jgi:uncharacterized membrane protein